MTQYLPPNLLALFAPREPLPFLPPACRQPHEKKTRGYFGVYQYLDLFEDPKDTPPAVKIETREERLERKKREKAEKAAYIREQGIALWDPANNAEATSDPYKTLFVARINPDTSESKLKREFEIYGPIKSINLVCDKISGKPKGYAFVEFENEKDMHAAYKYGDGRKIDDRRVLVDVERGRTVKGWLPRRLGGGLGSSSKSRADSEPDDRGFRDRNDRREQRDRIRRSSSKDRGDRKRRRSKSRERDRSIGRKDRSERKDEHRERDKVRDRGERDRGDRDRGDRKRRRSKSRERDRSISRKDRSERKDEPKVYLFD